VHGAIKRIAFLVRGETVIWNSPRIQTEVSARQPLFTFAGYAEAQMPEQCRPDTKHAQQQIAVKTAATQPVWSAHSLATFTTTKPFHFSVLTGAVVLIKSVSPTRSQAGPEALSNAFRLDTRVKPGLVTDEFSFMPRNS
jgi:hypothetical protein